MILYVTRSNADLRLSNFIQSNQMCKAFAKYDKVICLVKKSLFTSDIYKVYALGTSFLYPVICFLYFLFNARSISFVYSRYFHFSFLLSFFGYKKHFFEVHHNYFASGLYKFMFGIILKKSPLGCVVISNSLKQDILKSFPSYNAAIHVLHDAHHNSDKNFHNNIVINRFKVGYFGKVIPIKGSELLESLVRAMPHVDFYIYSQKRDREFNYANVFLFDKLNHESVLSEMYKMNLFLLPIESIGTKHDFSSFTSPLKLFEYLSCGRPVICSNFPSIKEFSNSPLILLDNDVSNWVETINDLSVNLKKLDSLSKDSFQYSKEFTWDNRVKKILDLTNKLIV